MAHQRRENDFPLLLLLFPLCSQRRLSVSAGSGIHSSINILILRQVRHSLFQIGGWIGVQLPLNSARRSAVIIALSHGPVEAATMSSVQESGIEVHLCKMHSAIVRLRVLCELSRLKNLLAIFIAVPFRATSNIKVGTAAQWRTFYLITLQPRTVQ